MLFGIFLGMCTIMFFHIIVDTFNAWHTPAFIGVTWFS